MDKKKLLELINKEIDHEISKKENMELQNFISENEKSKREYLELTNNIKLLNNVEQVPPPADLKQRIINKINFSKYPVMKKSGIKKNVFYLPKFKLAYSFAAGIIVGIMLLNLFTPNYSTFNQIDSNDLSATIGTQLNDSIIDISDYKIESDLVSGKIEVKKFNNLVWFVIELKSEKYSDIYFEFDENKIILREYNSDLTSAPILMNKNYVKAEISSVSPVMIYFMKKTQDSANVKINIRNSEKLITEKYFKIN